MFQAPLRLLLVIDSLDIGGAERHVVDLAIGLRDRGHEVTVASSAPGPLAAELRGVEIPVHVLMPVTVKRRTSLLYAWRLRALLRDTHIDLVHAHVYTSAVAAALATVGRAVPLVLTAHSEGDWQGRGARWMAQQSYRRAAGIIAVSDRMARHLLRHGVPADYLTVIPNAVTPARAARHCAIPSLIGSRKGPLVGVVARLQPEKGIDVFLQAARYLRPLHPEVQIVIIGDGPERTKLHALSRRLGLSGRVHFLGLRPDARALISTLDVLAVPSLTEGSPLIVLEAMAAAVPIVATAVGGIPEQIRHGREGLLVPPEDAPALAAAIATLLDEPVLAQRLGTAAYERSASRFPYERMLGRTEECYKAALRSVDGAHGSA